MKNKRNNKGLRMGAAVLAVLLCSVFCMGIAVSAASPVPVNESSHIDRNENSNIGSSMGNGSSFTSSNTSSSSSAPTSSSTSVPTSGTSSTPTSCPPVSSAPSSSEPISVPSRVNITIGKPKPWLTSETDVSITVDANVEIAKVEGKTTNNGSYEDITDDMIVSISENCTVYIQVTDVNGKVYNKTRYLEVYDRVNPTVKARIDKELLRVESQDNLSGVSAIYVNGEKYESLINGTLDVKLKDIDNKFATISVQAQDFAGNKSTIVEINHPHYKDENKEKPATAPTPAPVPAPAQTPSPTLAPATPTPAPAPAPEKTPEGGSGNSQGGGSISEQPVFGTFEDTNKQFLSIVTKDGHTFYLIIDLDKDTENVYLLTEVSNADLERLSVDGQPPDTEEYPEYIGDKPKDDIQFEDETEQPEDTSKPEDASENIVPSEKPQGSSPGTYIFIFLLVAAVGGGAYYIKIYKPKKEFENADDLDDYEFEEEESPADDDFEQEIELEVEESETE